jgi:Tfp pilus assembly protein PilF
MLGERNLMTCITHLLIVFLLLTCPVVLYAAPPINEQPMYGGVIKTEQQKKSDEAFIAEIEQKGYSREVGSRTVVQKGWEAVGKHDYGIAMRRFNQAWLLDPENGDAYHGFAVVVHQRDNSLTEAEKYFRMALSKSKVGANAYVDYGRLLWLQGRYDESLAQLSRALEKSPKGYNAYSNMSFVYYKKGDFDQACKWAKAARENNDQLEPGYLEDMCRRAGDGQRASQLGAGANR